VNRNEFQTLEDEGGLRKFEKLHEL
jgi:hypothetical protein